MTTFRIEMATNDADEAISYLGKLHAGLRLSPRHDRFALRIAGAGDGRFSALTEGIAAAGQLTTVAPDALIVLETASGHWTATNGRTIVDTSRPVLDPRQSGTAKWDGPFSIHATHINADELDRVAAEYFGVPRLHVHFLATMPVSTVRDRIWRATSAFVREMVANDGLLGNQLVRDSTFKVLVANLLATFPNSTYDLAAARDGGNAVPAAIRRSIAYMEENIGESIQLEDIALAARMSPRGLQDAFVRLVGTTPTRHLRRMRLEATRTELLATDPTDGVTVADIARRWGFAHLARFAARYRAEYGENPMDSLRR